MSYSVFISSKAHKQYGSLDRHIQDKIESIFSQIKKEPHTGFSLLGKKYTRLLYRKIKHKSVEYRAVYDINDEKREILIVFLGTRENFYKELRRYLG